MGRLKLSEEERKQRNKERFDKWKAKNSEHLKEYQAEYHKKYNAEHKEELAEYKSKYRQTHKDEIAEYQTNYRKTQIGRAVYIVANYDRNDKKHNLGECTLTPIWIVDNIFPMPCHYCGAMGWEIMGCDRVDNSKPHTPDNVVPCCWDCNKKRGSMSYEEFMDMFK